MTSSRTETLRYLYDLPASERWEALEQIVVREFKATLLMSEAEELPVDRSYFELGFTSVRISEAKTRLETLLGRPISANVLFNQPTVEQLVAHLAETVLSDNATATECGCAGAADCACGATAECACGAGAECGCGATAECGCGAGADCGCAQPAGCGCGAGAECGCAVAVEGGAA